MIDIVCAVITGLAAIICAAMAAVGAKREKREKAERERIDRRAAQRAKEGRLQLAMIDADCKLTVGVAMALKRGDCNGEVEAGLEAVRKTTKEYEQFLEGIAMDHITK